MSIRTVLAHLAPLARQMRRSILPGGGDPALLFNSMAGLQMDHIPYKGISPAITALLGNEVNLASKLGEELAKTNEILLTRAARAAAGDPAGVTWEEVAVEYVTEPMYWRARY